MSWPSTPKTTRSFSLPLVCDENTPLPFTHSFFFFTCMRTLCWGCLGKTGRDTKRAMEGANRWTDNVYAIRKHCENQFGMSGSEFDQAFQVPADFDYME